jgi:hypothetical protein
MYERNKGSPASVSFKAPCMAPHVMYSSLREVALCTGISERAGFHQEKRFVVESAGSNRIVPRRGWDNEVCPRLCSCTVQTNEKDLGWEYIRPFVKDLLQRRSTLRVLNKMLNSGAYLESYETLITVAVWSKAFEFWDRGFELNFRHNICPRLLMFLYVSWILAIGRSQIQRIVLVVCKIYCFESCGLEHGSGPNPQKVE